MKSQKARSNEKRDTPGRIEKFAKEEFQRDLDQIFLNKHLSKPEITKNEPLQLALQDIEERAVTSVLQRPKRDGESSKEMYEMTEENDARILKMHKKSKAKAEHASCICKRDSTAFDEDEQIPAYNSCMDMMEAEGVEPIPDDYVRAGHSMTEERRRRLLELRSDVGCGDPLLQKRTRKRRSLQE